MPFEVSALYRGSVFSLVKNCEGEKVIMYNEDIWNRKDARPEKTISKIREILDGLGIKTEIVEKTSYKNFWYSNRIEIEGLPTIGTNGKGVNEEYALASCYGEFMERLQSGILLGYLYSEHEKSSEKNDSISGIKKIFGNICNDLCDDEIKNVVELSNEYGESVEYQDIITNEKCFLPESIVNILCGSNGLAAGNTFEEAYVQGISEICERFVTQFIYTQEENDKFSVLEESVYKDTKSFSLINAIQNKNYYVYVVDCTLDGLLPVVGVLVFDPSKTKYFFKMGSDPNLDIALQRCITEIFQGVSFDINFKLHMNDFFACDKDEQGFWYGENRRFEHTKAEVDGTGLLPRSFFRCMNNVKGSILGFCREDLNNKDAAIFMTNIIKRISKNIFIKNYTNSGFPCIRILIPNMCESFYYPKSDLINVITSINQLKKMLYSNNFEYDAALNFMCNILEYPAYIYEFNMAKILGVIISDIYYAPYLYNPYLFTAYLALHLNKYDIALKYMDMSNKNSRCNSLISKINILAIKAMEDGVGLNALLEFIKPVDFNGNLEKEITNLYRIQKNGIDIPRCYECKKCSFNDMCQISIVRQIHKNILQKHIDLDYEFQCFSKRVTGKEFR